VSAGSGGRYRAIGGDEFRSLPQFERLPRDLQHALSVVGEVLPFRVNRYVVDELIDWDDVPDDPIFRLVFPHPSMIERDVFARIERGVRSGDRARLAQLVREAHRGLNANPGGQVELNVPLLDGKPLAGVQHKYRETLLFFPRPAQTCHAYCSYCFRWSQFIGDGSRRFASYETDSVVRYLKAHREITSVLITGGDPLVLHTAVLRRYVEPLLADDLEHVTTIRLGTKSLAFWPQRYVSDDDADDLVRFFETILKRGRRLILMAHYSHPRELSTASARSALRRVVDAGAAVYCQSPVMAGVNDSASAWVELLNVEVQMGAIPYYMFVLRNTGAYRHFALPLVRAHAIYREALASVSGLARTLRGPVMSTEQGKVVLDGVARGEGGALFSLRFLQARDPSRVGVPFFARYDADAIWFDELDLLDPAW